MKDAGKSTTGPYHSEAKHEKPFTIDVTIKMLPNLAIHVDWNVRAPDDAYIDTGVLEGTDPDQLMQLIMKRIKSAVRAAT